jgi:membrane fusion protein (multidrug efflux system)
VGTVFNLEVKEVKTVLKYFLILSVLLCSHVPDSLAASGAKNQGPPKVPVRVATVSKKLVSNQISLIGTAEAVAESTVAAEVSGVVEYFPIREGDFVKKGQQLVRLKSTYLRLRFKAALASRDIIKANLENAGKELERVGKLMQTKSIAAKRYDNALYSHRALEKRLLQSDVEIEQLEYEIKQKEVVAPFSGFVAQEHTQVGEWINPGGAVATLIDLSKVRITVDVPERYSVTLSPKSKVRVWIKSLSEDPLFGRITAVLPRGDSASRTFPIRIRLANPGYKIKSGMEAIVNFNLREEKSALLLPKDAVVTSGNNRMVFVVLDGKALPVGITVLGYYDGDVAVEGKLKAGALVVTRGNERLRPGQAVQVIE